MSQAQTDRNLLLGVLAYQNALVSKDALFAGMAAWLYDKTKSLAEILLGQGALSKERCLLLEALVQEHLKQNDNDPQKSLQAVSSINAVRSELQHLQDPQLQASIASLRTLDPDATQWDVARSVAASSDAAGASTSLGTRFVKLRPHAKGGLGEVSVARDTELNRDVALKEIQARFADHPDSRARFLLEAEITGALEHPGIVPVYGLGTYADGRPFYAMRFIQGDSLMDAIKKFHAGHASLSTEAAKPGPDKNARIDFHALEFHKLLRRLIDVCNAMQYAHDRGVLHRDLKPGNIMLGKYGETLVVDWGLAKSGVSKGEPGASATGVFGEPSAPVSSNEPLIRPSSGSSAETEAGAALGTPAYMSPEQAAGRLDLLGPASDVYSLGATLYCLLTGQPPVQGKDMPEVLMKVQRGDFSPPRRSMPMLSPALEAICLKALALEPQARYASPVEMAEDLEHWLADEPVSAWPEPWTVKTRRWVSRHRTLVAAAAATIIVAAVGLTIAAGLQMRLSAAQAKASEADAKADAAKATAATQEYYSLENRVRQRNADPRPGWTWAGLDDLAKARSLTTTARDDYQLRNLAVLCLAGADLREKATLPCDFTPSLLAFSPDGRFLAAAPNRPSAVIKCPVQLFDLSAGRPSLALNFVPSMTFFAGKGVPDGPRKLLFSPDGKWLVVGARNGSIHCWDLHGERKPLTWKAHATEVRALAFSRDGRTLYSSGAQTVSAWSMGAPGKGLAHYQAAAEVGGLALIQPDEGRLAVALLTANSEIRLDPVTLKPAPDGLKGRLPDANYLQQTRCGQVFLSGNHDDAWLSGLAENQRARALLEPGFATTHFGGVSGLDLSPDGALAATASDADEDRSLKLWETASARLLIAQYLGGVKSGIDCMFSPDGKTLAATGEKNVVLYEVGGGEAMTFVGPCPEPVLAGEFLEGGRRIALETHASDRARRHGGSISIWDPVARRQLKLKTFGAYDAVHPLLAAQPHGDRLLFRGEDAQLMLWEGDTLRQLPVPKPRAITRLSLSRDGATLWGLDGPRDLVAWDSGTGKERRRWSNQTDFLTGRGTLICLRAGRQWLLVGARDGVRLFHQADGRMESLWTTPYGAATSLALSDDEKVAAVGFQNGRLRLISVPEGRVLVDIEAHHKSIDALDLANSAQGIYLVSGARDRTFRLWRFNSTALEPLLSVPTEKPVRHLRLSPDGQKLLMVCDQEYAARLWHLDRLAERLAALRLSW